MVGGPCGGVAAAATDVDGSCRESDSVGLRRGSSNLPGTAPQPLPGSMPCVCAAGRGTASTAPLEVCRNLTPPTAGPSPKTASPQAASLVQGGR